MKNQHRDEIIRVVAELSERYPNWRFGQLVANVADWTDQEIWDVDDDRLLQAARSHLEHLAASESQVR